ncbi:unnamed protein product [Dracunculus medinensis]|uniref:Uncharacterized protein n=1 Tax=Dracunculus medinensis TaxID=318479 RepID=A0A0N4UEM8_DRAME|nr:unnamed protein product [Dracunculus medinensis]
MHKNRFEWLNSISDDLLYIAMKEANTARPMLIRQAQFQGIIDNEKAKWNLYYDEYEKLWKSMSRLENSELNHTLPFSNSKSHSTMERVSDLGRADTTLLKAENM